MIFALCATKNMYPQLKTMITMLEGTQENIEKIYCFTEGNFNYRDNKVEEICVKDFEKIKNNEINRDTPWTYMVLTRCYFTELLPNVDKIIYLDLDLWIQNDISELWNYDMTNYAIAAVPEIKELGYGRFPQAFYDDLDFYCNAGIMVMNLKYIRENGLDKKIQDHLENTKLHFPDQDAINLGCNGHILKLDGVWNSNEITECHGEPKIYHVIGLVKPWNPWHPMFPYWCSYYFNTPLFDRDPLK